MKRKKVLFVGRTVYDFPLDNLIYRKWFLLSKHFEIKILASTSSALNRELFQSYRIHFHLIPKTNLLDQFIFFVNALSYELFLIFNQDLDIIICQGPLEGIISAIGKTIATLFGKRVKIVQEFHGEWEAAFALYWNIKSRSFRRFIGFLMRILTIFLIKKVDAIRVVTKSMQKNMASYIKNKYVVQFPAYIDIDYFLKKERKVKKNQTKIILFVGVLHYLKGVQYLVEAIPQIQALGIQKIRVVIVGNGPYRSFLQGLSKKLNLEDYVQFVGEKSSSEVKKHLYQSDVLVLPSLSEGLPRVIIEAMACGKPVVASCVGGITEIVKENYNGSLFHPGNVDELAIKIYEILSNPQLSKKLGENGRTFTRAFFSVEKYINGYKSLVNHLDGAS